MTTSPQLVVAGPPADRIWRVGFRPSPWAWSDWRWAQDGRFHGRWDDRNGNFRTLYVASSLIGCLLEVLAPLRPDLVLAEEVAAIDEDPKDAEAYPTVEPGEVDPSWLDGRAAGSAQLGGDYCAVTAMESVAALRPHFIAEALRLGRVDFDVSVLKDGGTRELTQGVSTYVYEQTDLAGLRFASRHGDDLSMWAIFERAADPAVSPQLSAIEEVLLEVGTPDLLEAFRFHRLRWCDQPPPAELPLPLVEVDDTEEALARIFGAEGPTARTPLGAASFWHMAIEEPETFAGALEQLTVDTSLWGDFSEAHSILRSLSMTSMPIPDPDEPDRVVHVKFIDYAGEGVARSSGSAVLVDIWLLTLRRDEGADGTWRVWGLKHNHHPPAAEVLA